MQYNFLILVSFLVTSCVSNNSTSILDMAKPIIDTKGVDMTLYETDLDSRLEIENIHGEGFRLIEKK